MRQEDEIRARITTLKQELAAIDQTNAAYWQKQTRNPEGEPEFQRRIARLEQIVEELGRLTEVD